MMRYHLHVGAYGLLMVDGHILLTLKSRGPYLGFLDLPGGCLESGERPEETLCREFIEETGIRPDRWVPMTAFSNFLCHPTGEGWEELSHVGLVYRVFVDGPAQARSDPDGRDSGGVLWIRRGEIDPVRLTPFARMALDHPSPDVSDLLNIVS